jgi:hypothetical protein
VSRQWGAGAAAPWHAALGMLCIRCCWQMRDVQQSMYRLLAGARFTQLRYLPEQPAGMGGAGAAGAAGQHGAPLHRAMQPAARAGSGLPFNFTWIPLSPMCLSRLLIPTPPQLCFFSQLAHATCPRTAAARRSRAPPFHISVAGGRPPFQCAWRSGPRVDFDTSQVARLEAVGC